MSADLAPWVESRLAGAPPALAAAVRAALGAPPWALAHLEERAERLMREAQGSAERRAGALTLLAADALTTLASEWRTARPRTASP